MVYVPILSPIIVASYGIPPVNRHHTGPCSILLFRSLVPFPVQAADIIQIIREGMFKVALCEQFKLFPQSEAQSQPDIAVKGSIRISSR